MKIPAVQSEGRLRSEESSTRQFFIASNVELIIEERHLYAILVLCILKDLILFIVTHISVE